MTHKHNGGPAFPFGQTDSISGQLVNGWGSEGMTLRDYFAAKVAGAVWANLDMPVDYAADFTAEAAYKIADAMLKARDVGNDNQ